MAESRSSTSSAMMTSRFSASAPSSAMHSSSSASSSRPATTPSRRSMAHTPRLLLREDGEIPLHGLGISSAASEHFPASAKSARASVFEEDLEHSEDERFRIDEEDEIETSARHHEGHNLAERQRDNTSQKEAAMGTGENRRRPAPLLALNSYKGLAGFEAEQGEDSAMIGQEHDKGPSGDDTIDFDLERNGSAKHTPNKYAGLDREEDADHEPEYTARLYFEPVTAREKIWMIASVCLVSMLTAVAIAISVNWIDWPNDGIGKD